MHTRRGFLKLSSGAVAALHILPGCRLYRAARGPAYAAWDFPDPSLPDELHVAHAGLLAANPHNTQPWRFVIGDGRVELHRDASRSLGAMDGHHREMHIGLGCAVENMVIGAAGIGLDAEVAYFEGEETLVAALTLTPTAPPYSDLYEVIALRHTNRAGYAALPLPGDVAAALRSLCDEEDASLTLLTGADEMAEFADRTVTATGDIVADAGMLAASDAWYRHTREEIDAHKDGVTLDAQGFSRAKAAVAKLLPPVEGEEGGQYWINNTIDQVSACSAFVILSTGDRGSLPQQLRCGRVFQRIALQLEAWGMACQPLNQLAERWDREEILGLAPEAKGYLEALAPGAQMLFRVGFPEKEVHPAPRRPVDEVSA
jgi:hypothetical protein